MQSEQAPSSLRSRGGGDTARFTKWHNRESAASSRSVGVCPRGLASLARQLRLRSISTWLSNFGMDFPIEQPEEAAAALRVLNEHGRWSWRALEQVFQVSAATLSRMARNVPGAGGRSADGAIQALNIVWQEQMLAAQDMMSSVGSAEDTCAVCLFKIEEGDDITELVCSHTFHAECSADWLLRSPACPVCRDTGNRADSA